MKKIVLLLIVPFLVLATNVYADSVFSDYYEYGTFDAQSQPSSNGLSFNYFDITTGGTATYTDSNMDITFNGKSYTAHCLDPGLPRPQGDLTCKPINRNPAINALGEMTKTGTATDNAVATLAYRIWATVNERTNQDKEQKGFKQTVEAYSKIMSDDVEAKTTYGQQFGICSGAECATTSKEEIASKIFGENLSLFQSAWGIAMAANELGQYEYDKYEQAQGRVSVGSSTQSGQNVKIRLTSGGAVIKKEDIQVVCSKGCTLNSFDWSGYGGTADITVTSTDCKYELQFYYPTEGSYECTTNESNTQTLYTHVDETTTTAAQKYEGMISGDSDGATCENKCCTDAPQIKPGSIFGNVNNCCWNTHSEAYEYALNDLFCKDEDMELKWWKTKCNVEGSIYEKDINDFCLMYCTERVTVDLPGAVTASSGRYFQLQKNPKGNTTSPYIQGFKRCRVKVDFQYWMDSYAVQLNNEIKAFNDFQKHQAAKETIENIIGKDSGKDYQTKQDYSFTFVCQVIGSEGTDMCSDDTPSGKTTEPVEDDWELDDVSPFNVTVSGTLYNYEINYVVPYSTIKAKGPIDEDEDNFYNEWTIEMDKAPRLNQIAFPSYNSKCSKNTEVSDLCLYTSSGVREDYDSAWGTKVTDSEAYHDFMNDIKNALSDYINVYYYSGSGDISFSSGKKYEEVKTCQGYDNGGRTHRSYYQCTGYDQVTNMPEYKNSTKKFSFRKYINEYMDQLPAQSQSLFSAAASTAKKLEEDLDLCTNYFTKTDPNSIYKFNASAQFSYSQQYLSEKGELVRDEIPIPFTGAPGCKISLASTGKTGETEDPQYTPKYSKDIESKDDQIIKIKDLKDTTLDIVDWYDDGSAMDAYFDEEVEGQKKMTHDGLLQAVCEWNEGDNRIYTLAQSGVVQKETTNVKNFTIHDRQYQVHLTTLEGSFETFWKVQGLGSDGKFDPFFMSYGNTCAGEKPAQVNSMFTCMLNVEHEVVLTGYCNGVVNQNGDANCDPFKEGYELVNFKVVDPADLFPSVSGNQTPSYEGQEYAHNWVEDPEGKQVLGIIESKGAKDTTYAPQNLSYAFTLTPQDMKHIKNYNETRIPHGGYTDFELKCSCPSNPLPLNSTESCSKCKSTFIENLSNGRVMINGRSEDVTGWSNKNENLGSVRNGNNW